MSLRPQLNVTCGRCGKPRGLVHECVNGSTRRKPTLKPTVTFGKCPDCKKTITNPLAHICAPKSDFKRRKREHDKQQKARQPKKRQPSHDYTACPDSDCPRPLCVAYKTGWKAGDEAGYERGWETCYPAAFEDGIAHCPRLHK
jgi:hypothetical protein